MSKENFTEDELAGLSDEERAAIEDDDTDGGDDKLADDVKDPESASAGDKAGDNTDGDDKSSDGDDKEADGSDADADAAKDNSDGKDVAAKSDDNQDDVKDDDNQDDNKAAETNTRVFAPHYEAKAPEKYQEQMDGFETQLKEVKGKFEEGDLSVSEYMDKRDTIASQRYDLREQKLKSDMSAEQSKQVADQVWEHEQDLFFDQHPEYRKDTILWGAMDASIRELTAKAENVNRSGMAILNDAHKQVSERFSQRGTENKEVDKEETNDKKDNPNKQLVNKEGNKQETAKKPDLSVVPKTLSDMPNADGPDTGTDTEFTYLDKLGGVEYENALAKLSDDQQDRYLRSS